MLAFLQFTATCHRVRGEKSYGWRWLIVFRVNGNSAVEYDIHTVLDICKLKSTYGYTFVTYMIGFKLRSTDMVDNDNFTL